MRRANDILILIMGILLFLISYNIDSHVSLFFRGAEFPLLSVILGVITNFGLVVLVTLILPSLVLYKKNSKSVYLLWLAFIVSFILAFIVKLLVLRQRPIEALAYPFTNIINYSFPSMHSMIVFSLLPILTRHLPKQKHFWVIFAFLVAFSRIYFGFHFLSDVVFGALFGYFIGNYFLELSKKEDYGNKQV